MDAKHSQIVGVKMDQSSVDISFLLEGQDVDHPTTISINLKQNGLHIHGTNMTTFMEGKLTRNSMRVSPQIAANSIDLILEEENPK